MKIFIMVPLLGALLASTIGCAITPSNVPVTTTPTVAGSEYCHKKLPAVGPSGPSMVQPSPSDIIDYYGPCDGPTAGEQLEQQRRFEAFRFGREYMDEG